MATDNKKHTTIAAGETPSRAALAAALLSIRDLVPVANATEANQVAAAVAAGGQPLATDPIAVARLDAPGLHMIELSTASPGVWRPASGVLHFANDAARDSWTSANSALLTVGDRCVSNNIEYRWRYGGWVPVDPTYVVTTSPTQSGITAATVVTGLSVTITLPGTANLRVRIELTHFASNVDTVLSVDLKDGATGVANWPRQANSSPTSPATNVSAAFDCILTGVAAGTHTFTVTVTRATGTGTITVAPSPTNQNHLSVEVI